MEIFFAINGSLIEPDPNTILSAPFLKYKSASCTDFIPPPTERGTKQFVEKKFIKFKNSFENFLLDKSIIINSSILQRSIKFLVYL